MNIKKGTYYNPEIQKTLLKGSFSFGYKFDSSIL